jgi:preprotein translocase subunit SecE
MTRIFRNIVQFFRDVRAEMAKVIWPTRRDAIRYTITVIVFSLVMAAILGAADFGLLKGFQAIIK